MADDYEFGATYDDAAVDAPTSDNSYSNNYEQLLSTLNGTWANNPVAQALGYGELTGPLTASATVGGVAGLTQPGKEDSMLKKIFGWYTDMNSDDKKATLTVATLLAGGLANVGAGKRKDRELNIMESRATADTEFNRARIALEQQRMANGSAIGQTNFGTATQPLGMINAPVTLTRNRLKSTPGATQ